MNAMDDYRALNQPPLSPPSSVFPIVWTVLFILMGIASYFVYVSDSQYKKTALILYGVQLAMNFLWTLIYFNAGAYLFAFVWLVALWCVIIATTVIFWAIKPLAGVLMLPYILWVTFAGYLNFMIYRLN